MKVSAALRRAVEESGETRSSIARETGISEATLSRFVRGMVALNGDNTDTLAEYLDLRLVAAEKSKKGAR